MCTEAKSIQFTMTSICAPVVKVALASPTVILQYNIIIVLCVGQRSVSTATQCDLEAYFYDNYNRITEWLVTIL